MAWLAVDKDGTEAIFNIKPFRGSNRIKYNTEMWVVLSIKTHYIDLPKGTIKKLIGRELKWEDEPVKI